MLEIPPRMKSPKFSYTLSLTENLFRDERNNQLRNPRLTLDTRDPAQNLHQSNQLRFSTDEEEQITLKEPMTIL